MAGHIAYMGIMRNSHKPKGKKPLGRPRCRWEDIRMNLTEIGWEGVDWMQLAQDRD
jgi:hypothetical protein